MHIIRRIDAILEDRKRLYDMLTVSLEFIRESASETELYEEVVERIRTDLMASDAIELSLVLGADERIVNGLTKDAASRIRFGRKKRGLTQQELADEVGISRTYMSQIETGEADNVSYKMMVRLLNAVAKVPDNA